MAFYSLLTWRVPMRRFLFLFSLCCFCSLCLGLAAAGTVKADENEPFLKPWAEGVPYPMASEIDFPHGAQHVIVHDCDTDPEYGFLHETSIGQLDGELIVGWYNNPQKELNGKTIQRARRSKDFLHWSGLEIVQDRGSDEGWMYVGLQFLTLDGKLYCFSNQEFGTEKPTECILQVWKPETKTWEILGPIAEKFLSMQPPILMENGNYCMSGSLNPPSRHLKGNGTTPVVFISQGKEIEKPWRMVRMDPEDYVNIFAETAVLANGPNLLAVTRVENTPFPNFYESRDFGETWRKIENRVFAACNSKFAAGTFSNGYRYIVYNLPNFRRTADGKIIYKTDENGNPTREGIGMGRGTLVMAIAKPGETAFSTVWKVSDRTGSTEQSASHYPTVLEHDGFVYVAYTGNHKRRNCGVTRFPLKSLE